MNAIGFFFPFILNVVCWFGSKIRGIEWRIEAEEMLTVNSTIEW